MICNILQYNLQWKPNRQTIAIISTLWCTNTAQPRVCWSDGDFQSYARCCFSRPWSLSLRCRCCRCFWFSDLFVKKWKIVFCGFVQKRWAPLQSNGSVYLTFIPYLNSQTLGFFSRERAARACTGMAVQVCGYPLKNMFGYFSAGQLYPPWVGDAIVPLNSGNFWTYSNSSILCVYLGLPRVIYSDILWIILDNPSDFLHNNPFEWKKPW